MSDPQRLLDQPLEGLAAELLRAGVGERAPRRTTRRALSAVGVSGALTAVSASTAAATSAGKITILAILKWLALGIAVGVVTATVTDQALHSTSFGTPRPLAAKSEMAPPARNTQRAPHAPPNPTSEPAPPVARAAAAKPAAPIPAAALPSAARARAPVMPAEATPAPASATAPPPSSAELAREVSLIDQARALVSSGDPTGALRLLDRHDREFPRGALAPEALVLRIDALARAGARDEALRLGRPILDAAPATPQARRVRRILGDSPVR
jgi:hypothetical protein